MHRSMKVSIKLLLLGLLVVALTACSRQPSFTTDPNIQTSEKASSTLNPSTSAPDTSVSNLSPIDGGVGLILFASYRDGESEIYTMNVDGSDVKRLTYDEARISQPTWSPDGKRIAFVRRKGDEYLEIFVMNADGLGQLRIMTNYRCLDFDPAWSPDGTKIAFTSSRDSYYNSAGEKVSIMNIYMVDIDNLGQSQLTTNQAWDYSPSWSPNGERIAFQSLRDRNNEIYVMASDGSAQLNLTKNSSSDTSPAWSPNGDKIAFVSDRDGNEEIYIMDSNGSNQTRMTDHPAQDKSPAWSPDGRQIVFHSERDGNFDIYVMNADGTDVTRLTEDGNFDGFPSWRLPISTTQEAPVLSEPDPEDISRVVAFNLMAEINANAIPLTSVERGSRFDDLLPLKEFIGEAHIVDLGGLTFGTRESFTVRHRIMQYLVEGLDFNTIVFAVSREDGELINSYIQSGEGDPTQMLAELEDPRWNTQEMLDLIEWMRTYNQNTVNETRINFFGVEIEDPLLPMDLVAANLMQIDLGQIERKEYVFEYMGERSVQVAENIRRLLEQVGHDAKIILCAYNFEVIGIVGSVPSGFIGYTTSPPSVGSLFREIHGEDPYRIGFTFGRGFMNVYDSLFEDRMLTTVQIPQSPPGSFEWYAHNTAMPIFILPVTRIEGEDPETNWLNTLLPFRLMIGVSQQISPEEYFYPIRLPRIYDALVYFDNATPTQFLQPPSRLQQDDGTICSNTNVCTQ